jgi:hypothetical protein
LQAKSNLQNIASVLGNVAEKNEQRFDWNVKAGIEIA